MTRLFFYGVLIAEIAPPPVRRLLAGIGPGRPATARGTLWAVDDPAGAHPAMTPGGGTVKGVLHEAGAVDLAGLDAFEGADYARTPIAVDCDGARLSAQAYLWIASTAGLEPIPDGDFARWLAESGRPPIGH
ncbi:gamma-glutamylcyclotransferase [Tsuneonella sp. YG55]|uniref:Gamma-glutamylcyclotransferase n=1 Tax=Tsuneonella litorea TaxID=2976475 RepID=A0A9X3AK77_9SPHN|nr:gamma-glutamylcyclotransferase family protein [Tsuneonella litorea]MCT2558004.1 gamma-glutamylcyclotransferase [Tsuneonella litorea]